MARMDDDTGGRMPEGLARMYAAAATMRAVQAATQPKADTPSPVAHPPRTAKQAKPGA